MNKESINLIFWITTKGHFGRKDLYQYTLKNLRDSIDLDFFKNKKLSIKQFSGDESECLGIINNMPEFEPYVWRNNDKRICDDSSYNDYAYYLLNNYLLDICNVYSDENLLNNEYTYIIEDDSPLILDKYKLEHLIKLAIDKLKSDKNIFSIHFERFFDKKETFNNEILNNANNDYNFQNQIFRTRDMFDVVKIIKNNYTMLHKIHTERAVKIAINNFNKNSLHLFFPKSWGYSIHIGTDNSQEIINTFSLKK